MNVARALMCLAPGLVAFSAVNIVARAFYALGDTTTPMRVSVFCLLLNILFSALFLFGLGLGAAGLAAANSITSTINLGLLLFALRRKLAYLGLGPLRESLAASLGAATLAGVVAWVSWQGWERVCGGPPDSTVLVKIGAVLVPMVLATLAYAAVCGWAGVPAVREMWRLCLGRSRRN